jgi:hypothetical protein
MNEIHLLSDMPNNKPGNGANGGGPNGANGPAQVNGTALGAGDAPVSRQVHRQAQRDNEKSKPPTRSSERTGFPRWWVGFQGSELLPIIPPGAPLGATSDVHPKMRGKVPGTWDGTHWWGLTGSWANDLRAGLDDVKRWHKWKASVALQTRIFSVIDIDVDDEKVANAIGALALDIFGDAPIRYREGSNRLLLLYRIKDGELPLTKRVIKFRVKPLEEKEKPEGVELLGHGQQCVVEGPHPDGGEYLWRNTHPCERTPANITRITKAQVDTFFAQVADYLDEHRYPLVTKSGRTAGASGTRKPLSDTSLHAPSPERVLELLAAVPCDDTTFPTRDEFVGVLASIKAALAGSDEHWPDVLAWALNFPGAEEDYVTKMWNSFTDAEVGWSYLEGWSRKHGCTIGAQHAFKDSVDIMKIGLDGPVDRMVAENVLVKDQEKFYNINTWTWSTQNGINQAYADSVRPYRSAGSKDSAAVLLLNDPRLERVVTTTSAPGEPPITAALKNGVSVPAVNLWRRSSVKAAENVTDGDVTLFLDIFTMLFGPLGNPEPEHILNYWAYILQNPGKKIGHALVITGPQGVGKDTILRAFFEGVGLHNVASISKKDLDGQFNFFLKSQVVYFQEAKTRGQHDLYNGLKPWLSAQATFHVVNEKGLRQYYVPNVQNWIVSSNHDDAIALEADDRRFSVHRVLLEEPPDDGYFDPLHTWYDNGGIEKVVGWLLARDLSGFNPKAKPADTLAKKIMLREAQPASVRWVRELIGEGGKLGTRSVLTVRELKDMAEGDWNAPREISEKQITAALKGEGFKAAHRVRLGNSMSQLWARGLDGSVTADAMRARYFAEAEDAKCKAAA